MEAYKTLLTTVTPARFKVGQMIGATGLLLGVALAMYRRVDADKKDKYRSLSVAPPAAVSRESRAKSRVEPDSVSSSPPATHPSPSHNE